MTMMSADVVPYAPNSDVDPLGAAPSLELLPELNRTGDLRSLMQRLDGLIPSGPITELPGVYEEGGALGAIADLDMIMSSIRRLGVEPAYKRPDITLTVAGLGMIATEVNGAADKALRATLDTYVYPRRLPSGERAMFSGLDSERVFVDQLQLSFVATRRAATALSSANLQAAETDELVWQLSTAEQAAQQMLESNKVVNEAYRFPPNGPFATKHRPYFGTLIIGGKKIAAASGDQLPSKEMELLLRGIGSDHEGDGKMFAEFYDPNIEYTPAHRQAEVTSYVRRNGELSFFNYIRALEPGDRRARLATAYLGAFGALTSYAKAHGGIVRRDFDQREDPNGKGGGGYSIRQVVGLKDERKVHYREAMRQLAA